MEKRIAVGMLLLIMLTLSGCGTGAGFRAGGDQTNGNPW